MSVLETVSKVGVWVRLTEVQWEHIFSKHPEMVDQQERIRATLESPERVYVVPRRQNHHYYRLFDQTPVTRKKYLAVIVKHLNQDGFVITAYYTTQINERNKERVYEKGSGD